MVRAAARVVVARLKRDIFRMLMEEFFTSWEVEHSESRDRREARLAGLSVSGMAPLLACG